MSNPYSVQALIDRVTLKCFTSVSTSLTPQQLVDLANDSLRSYLVPLAGTLREEWWIGRTDIVLVSGSDGSLAVPDSVASSLRTVSWNNAGILTPLTRIEPESSFQYLAMGGSLPVGFELRGFTMFLMPPVPGISVHITAMLRPPQMVLDTLAAEIASAAGPALTLDSVPLAWQAATPATVDLVSGVSPFSLIGNFAVVSLVGSVLTLASTPTLPADAWVSDPGTSPFANVPIELYPLLEQDVMCQLLQGLGDKRLKGVEARKEELESFAKRAMAPRASGNSRPIVNASAPGMRMAWGRYRG